LVQEALDYAAQNREEIEKQIHDHVSWTPQELKRLLPEARGIAVEPGGKDLSTL
jgi:hypothetical protein